MIPAQYFQKLVNTDDIWEVRVQFGGNIFRLLRFLEGASLMILTNGFAKKTQKTPPQEIELAEQRRADHLERKCQIERKKTAGKDDHE
jgi:phage-related protein